MPSKYGTPLESDRFFFVQIEEERIRKAVSSLPISNDFATADPQSTIGNEMASVEDKIANFGGDPNSIPYL